MTREVPFDRDDVCDNCGAFEVYDFMGFRGVITSVARADSVGFAARTETPHSNNHNHSEKD